MSDVPLFGDPGDETEVRKGGNALCPRCGALPSGFFHDYNRDVVHFRGPCGHQWWVEHHELHKAVQLAVVGDLRLAEARKLFPDRPVLALLYSVGLTREVIGD